MVEFPFGFAEKSIQVVGPFFFFFFVFVRSIQGIIFQSRNRALLTGIWNFDSGVDEASGTSSGLGVAGSCFTSGISDIATGGGAFGLGGLAGAFPLAFALGLGSNMN